MAQPNQDGSTEEITMANTKKEMLAAYNALLKRLDEKREADMKPEEKIQEKLIEEAVQVADSLSMEGIGKEIGNLRSEIGTMLVQLSDKLEAAIEKYVQTTKAVQTRERQLAEIYEIEKSASSLTALIEAQRQKREESETEIAAEREALESEIESLREEWEREQELHAAVVKEREGAEKKQRDREAEEYKYKTEREKRILKEEFEYEKSKLERESRLQREEMEADLAVREKALGEREAELEQLRAEVEAFPQGLETGISKAVEEATERLTRERETSEELLRREADGEQRVLQSRIESLQQTVQEQGEQLATFARQLENSYGQVQDIAVKAIEGSSNVKSFMQLQSQTAEPARKAAEKDE